MQNKVDHGVSLHSLSGYCHNLQHALTKIVRKLFHHVRTPNSRLNISLDITTVWHEIQRLGFAERFLHVERMWSARKEESETAVRQPMEEREQKFPLIVLVHLIQAVAHDEYVGDTGRNHEKHFGQKLDARR